MTATVFWNYCRFQSSTAGMGSFTAASPAPTDTAGPHDLPENCSVISGNSYRYYARTADGTQVEWGIGVYTSGVHLLSRSTILVNSDGTTAPVNFTAGPLVDVFPNPQRTVESPTFPAGTRMLFQNTNAPVGWTKDMAYNDWAVRIVNGTVGTGGVNGFSTMFTYRTDDPTTLSVAQMPSHQHSDTYTAVGGFTGFSSDGFTNAPDQYPVIATTLTGAQGGGSFHQHTYDMRVVYIDFIIATKG